MKNNCHLLEALEILIPLEQRISEILWKLSKPRLKTYSNLYYLFIVRYLEIIHISRSLFISAKCNYYLIKVLYEAR